MKTFLNAIGFLTIIKVPERFFLKKQNFWKITYYFPLTGILIGFICALFYFAASFVMPSIVCVILTIGFEVLISGAMHLDGLSDATDGIFSGESDKAQILRIMKKSNIGAFGVLALIFLFALKFSFFYALIEIGSSDIYGVLVFIIFMPAFGRWTINYNFSKYGNLSREGSLAKSFVNDGNKKVFIASTFYLFCLFLAAVFLFGFFFKNNYFLNTCGFTLKFLKNSSIDFDVFFMMIPVFKVVAIILLVYFFTCILGSFFVKKIGSLSGDAIGALVEIIEVFYLFSCFTVIKYF
ncbi:MAG: adenosylcobinamide-GDP ribazoletransferase [Actinomycetota bacterium]|nr:adenosylcobinamide-GDP ribazoletransferase [Actinomycetota bacterium]